MTLLQTSISVIIPAYNAAQTLGECLDALRKQTVPREAYEVIVVDDGSTDETHLVAQSGGARVIRQDNSGPAAGRNAGIATSKGDLILFTDADCVPAADWIERMVEPLADPEISGSKGVYRTRQSSLAARFIQVEYEDRYDHTARQQYVDFIDTYAAGYRRRLLVDMGGFSTGFPLASVEDQELSFRLAEAGHRMVFCPGAIVFHRHPESWIRYARRKFKIGYWKTLVLHLHPSKVWRDSHTPWNLKVQMVLAAASAPLVALAPISLKMAWAAGAVGAMFAATALPFLQKAWRRDRPVAWISLPALYVRAWSLGLGLAAGKLSQLLRRGMLWENLTKIERGPL